ncbi:MAG: hypothetical protein WC271_01615 [Bacteroidales bacterium]|jgi:hypothetical protein|nr:hypothetical protein [Bacteroidales bacterium]MDD2631503.1 hypothetical protein [Bacteroidales bacterium]MDD4175624.1 hypothetical protein [Bacteroidales bacterium]MDD4741792.1 hypothetical protein [Bacteroidales bacterium]NCU34442.1 hypothetical protein [Candidatus Falkowbacteria bacterium]
MIDFWTYFSQIPIAKERQEVRSKINTQVNKILKNKETNPGFDAPALETQIDQLVYQLYNLT